MKTLFEALVKHLIEKKGMPESASRTIVTNAMEKGGEVFANIWHKPPANAGALRKIYVNLVLPFLPVQPLTDSMDISGTSVEEN